jgi:predicted transposase YdaD
VYIPLGERELAKEIEQRGFEKGLEKGNEEKEKMVKNLLTNGVSPETIAKSAVVPVEQIRKLIN